MLLGESNLKNFCELYFSFIEVSEKRSEIIEIIQDRGQFTDAFRLDPKIKTRGIYAISFDGHVIEYFAKGEKTGRISTYVDRVKFSDFLEVKISIDQLKNIFPKLNSRLNGSASVVRIPPASTKTVFSYLEANEPRFTKWLKGVSFNQQDGPRNISQEERDDSFRLALQMANFDLNSGLVEGKVNGKVPSFLEGISNIHLSEDEMINHDFSTFENWNKCKSDIVGMAYFEKGNEKLFIWNINRKPLESVLGVDLIYFAEEYNSFVMVQYKRMARENDKWVYRANDKAYKRELQNMRAFEKLSFSEEIDNKDPRQFRLNNCPFYFKLCKSTIERKNYSSVIPGMYIPFNYWEIITSHDAFVKGERGGTAIGYHNAERWLTKDDFTNLVQKGWIGSNQLKSSAITRLIEASIKGERVVTLAAKLKYEQTCLLREGV